MFYLSPCVYVSSFICRQWKTNTSQDLRWLGPGLFAQRSIQGFIQHQDLTCLHVPAFRKRQALLSCSLASIAKPAPTVLQRRKKTRNELVILHLLESLNNDLESSEVLRKMIKSKLAKRVHTVCKKIQNHLFFSVWHNIRHFVLFHVSKGLQMYFYLLNARFFPLD